MPVREKVTLTTLRSRKRAHKKFSVLTCYDYPCAVIEEQAGVDVILVGDSVAQVLLGHHSTLPATMDLMITLTTAVRRGAPNVFLIGDMPYLSYQVNPDDAIRNAGRFMAEAGCDAVKVEGDGRMAGTVAAMARATIPVVAHLGLRPQAVHQAGGYRAQGRDAASARQLIEDARELEAAGACMLLLEAVPPEPAKIVAESVSVPVIGCGAGPYCDGHVVVLHDMLGLSSGPLPKFVKRYADLRGVISTAVAQYVADIESGAYPGPGHCYQMEPGEAASLEGPVGR
ncbi:MAG: 3-methyl-2-oxobutanoate hydroxymethyltransferase [Phycisphaerae bacterium]|nr:3-methyl-2-oxobutanoate hydroxymethyltransferase [Phycisphaerae bacterium]